MESNMVSHGHKIHFPKTTLTAKFCFQFDIDFGFFKRASSNEILKE